MATTKTPAITVPALVDFSVKTTTKNSEKHTTIYANATTQGLSPWDIRISFGQVVEGGIGTAIIESDITVIMSPGHAKALLGTMNQTIKEYERLFGEIKNPMDAINAATQANAAQSTGLVKKQIKK